MFRNPAKNPYKKGASNKGTSGKTLLRRINKNDLYQEFN